jgi:hypothetical protein
MSMATNMDQSSNSRVGGALNSVKGRASGAGDRLTGTVETSPLAAVAAGVALGAIAGALLPRTDRETEVLGPIGSKIGQAAADAAKAARDAGKQELGILAENKSPMEMMVEKAVDAVGKASSAAGTAAASAVTGKQDA